MTADSLPRFERVRLANEAGVLIVTFLDAELVADDQVHALRAELLAALHEPGLRKVVLDLQNVRYLSSAAIRPFLTLKQKMEERGGRVILCGLAPMLLEVFRVTRLIEQGCGLPGIFESADDLPTAVGRLAT